MGNNNKNTRGILLAGGTGSRLFPLTFATNKSLLPVYDKPLIYYSLSILMLAKITKILIITTPRDVEPFKQLLGDGSQWGISLQYAIQEKPAGIAQALIIAEKFLDGHSTCLILGDNIFHGQGLGKLLQDSIRENNGATIFGYYVSDPERYGVITFNENREAVDIVEKPENPASSYAVPGLYIYDNQAVNIAKSLRPSERNELEITDVNKYYLKNKNMKVKILNRGTAWMDLGTHASLIEAGKYIEIIEHRQGLKIACLEEIAWRMELIDDNKLLHQAKKFGRNNSYGLFLFSLLESISLQHVVSSKLTAYPC